MKSWKKLITALCAVVLAVSGWSVSADNSQTTSADEAITFDDQNILVSFGAMSDIHLKVQATDNDLKFANTLQKFKELAGGSDKLKAILIAGDLFDANPNNEAPRFMSILQTNLNPNDTELIPSIGNHDAYFDNAFTGKNLFRDIFGAFVYQHPVEKNTTDDITYGNYHTVINGIHFLSVTGIDGNHTDLNLSWLKKQLAIASADNPTLPIFVETHVPPADTVYGSDQEGRFQSTTIGPILEKFPQVIIFAGHTHKSAVQDTSIWHGSYTAVGTGTIASSAHFVQVDQNGVVKITPYATSTSLSDIKQARSPWIFKVKQALPTTVKTTHPANAGTENVKQASSENWFRTEKWTILLASAGSVILGAAVVLLLLKKRANKKKQ